MISAKYSKSGKVEAGKTMQASHLIAKKKKSEDEKKKRKRREMKKQIEIPDEYIDRLMCRIGWYTKDEIKNIRNQLKTNTDTFEYFDFQHREFSAKSKYSDSFETLKEYFKSIDEFDSFISNISDDKMMTFLNTMDFYQQSTQIIDKCEECNRSLTIRLIMMFSAIEKIMSGVNEYIDLKGWLVSAENKDKYKKYLPLTESNINSRLEKIYNKYNEEWGSIRKVRKFFNEIPENDKTELIKGFKFWRLEGDSQVQFNINRKDKKDEYRPSDEIIDEIKKEFEERKLNVPDFLYNDTILSDFDLHLLRIATYHKEDKTGKYRIEKNENEIIISVKELYPKSIREVAEILYKIRNQFVHNAKLDSVFKKEEADTPTISIDPKHPTIAIPITKIEDIFKRGVLKHYEFDMKNGSIKIHNVIERSEDGI